MVSVVRFSTLSSSVWRSIRETALLHPLEDLQRIDLGFLRPPFGEVSSRSLSLLERLVGSIHLFLNPSKSGILGSYRRYINF